LVQQPLTSEGARKRDKTEPGRLLEEVGHVTPELEVTNTFSDLKPKKNL